MADEGKVLRRISDGWLAGSEIVLGYAYRVGGELLKTPLLEVPEHYEEIIDPKNEEIILLGDGNALAEQSQDEMEYKEETPVSRVVTLADYIALEDAVKELKDLLIDKNKKL